MSDANARPAGFVLRARYSKVECPEPDYEGLWAEIRTNLTWDEKRAYLERSDQINEAIREYTVASLDEARQLDDAVRKATSETQKVKAVAKRQAFLDRQLNDMSVRRDQRLALIAPYIRAWNVCDADGNDVPAPMDGGTASFAETDETIMAWLTRAIDQGYRGGKGVRSSSSPSNDTPVPLSGPQIVSDAAA